MLRICHRNQINYSRTVNNGHMYVYQDKIVDLIGINIELFNHLNSNVAAQCLVGQYYAWNIAQQLIKHQQVIWRVIAYEYFETYSLNMLQVTRVQVICLHLVATYLNVIRREQIPCCGDLYHITLQLFFGKLSVVVRLSNFVLFKLFLIFGNIHMNMEK